jgi:hypothetical protein
MSLMLKLMSKGGCRPKGWSSMVVDGSSRLSMLLMLLMLSMGVAVQEDDKP